MNGQLPITLDSAREAWQLALSWFNQHEPLLIFLAVLLEESGVPMPLPADVAMALMGARVAQGRMTILEAFLIGQVATLLGSSVLYWVGRRGGRPLLFRYGRMLHVSPHRLAQTERLVTRLGPLSVIIGRQIPGLRLAAPLACGVFRVPYRLFVPAMIVGSSIYIGIFIAIGMWGGPAVLRTLRNGGLPLRFLLLSLLLGGALLLLRGLNRRVKETPHAQGGPPVLTARRTAEAALLSGVAASALTGLAVSWLLVLVTLVAQTSPERAVLQWLERVAAAPLTLPAPAPVPVPGVPGDPPVGPTPQRLVFVGLLATVPFQVATHILWAFAYAFGAEPRLRGGAALRGVQFALLPWLVSTLLVFPLLDGGVLGLDFGAGALPLLVETLRLAVFGLALGTVYRLFRLARVPRPHGSSQHRRHHPRAGWGRPARALPAEAPNGVPPGGAAPPNEAPAGAAVPNRTPAVTEEPAVPGARVSG